jgi:GT2 family glycosyltransferase
VVIPAQNLAVVVVNYGRTADTEECLDSIHGAPDGVAVPIVLVDNGSQDKTLAQMAARWPNITLVELPRNLGYTGGFNAGISAALRLPVAGLVLLNNDTLVPAGTLACLGQALAHWDVAVPKITYADQPGLIWAAGARWRSLPPSVVMRGFRRADSPAYNRGGPLEYATGCALAMRRQVPETIGGFDVRYESYWEDYDFCLRVREHGYTVGYEPRAVIAHKVSQTLGEGAPHKWHLIGKNAVLFFRTHRQFSPAALYAFVAWVSLRELIKGNGQALSPFLRGWRAGLKLFAATQPDTRI